MAEPPVTFAALLRRLRTDARLTQEELAEAAGLSPRSVSDLERGVNRTARKDTAELLAGALGLAGPTRLSFVAAARGRGSAEDVLAAREGRIPSAGQKAARRMHGCPYRGLLPFGESDAGVFYGRERLAAELAAKLAGRAASGGLVVVTGASGSGKSSLLRAGLLPILAKGRQLPGSEWWPRIVMTPTKDPLTELAARLAAVGGPDALAVRDELARHPDQAHLAIRSAVLAAAARRDAEPSTPSDGAARLAVIVDQFEQVFTLYPDRGGEAGRQAFITALCAAAANPVGPGLEPPALVVIAVRGDFSDRCAAVPELVSALQDGHFVVGPMTDSELRVAITGPAEAAGLRVDPALIDTILGDLRAAGADRTAGVLPLLSQAMALTWEHREEDRLTSRGYAQAGGVSYAVQAGADRVYEALPSGRQALARDVLRSMTVASRDGGFARRPVTREELYAGLPGVARSDIDAVLDALADERLAVLDGDTAQLSHDVLLRAWPRLRGWLEEDQASWLVHGQLADAAAAWQGSHDDPSFLYRGAQLAALQQAVTRWSANPARYPALTGTQRDFLQASERAAARSSRRRRGGFALLTALTVLAVVAAGLAFAQRTAAIRQRDQAIYNQGIAEALQLGSSNTSLAAQLNLAIYRIQPAQDLAARLRDTENAPLSSPLTVGSGLVNSVAFSPAGHTLATGDADGTIQLWDTANPAHPRTLSQPQTVGNASVMSVAFGAGGHTLASGVSDGTIRLWDTANPAHPRMLSQAQAGVAGTVVEVAFSPDGRTLATGDADGTIQLWDTTNPVHPRTLSQPQTVGNGPVGPAAFSPDGRTLASISDSGVLQLWDVADPARPRPLGPPLNGSNAPVDTVTFSPDGHTLASGGDNSTIRLWDTTHPAQPRPLGQSQAGSSTSTVASLAFSPDGQTLASGVTDGTIRLWDAADPAQLQTLGQPLTGSNGSVLSLAFSGDGHTLASGDFSRAIRLWSIPQALLASSSPVDTMTFSTQGRTLASGNADGTIGLWDTADPAHPRPLGQPQAGSSGLVTSVTFSADGRTLAVGDAHGTIRLWDLADPAHPRPLGQPQVAGIAAVDALAFSANGRTLASGGDDGTVQLWDITHLTHLHPLGQPQAGSGVSGAPVNSLTFSPDGRTLAAGNADGTIALWDTADLVSPLPLSLPQPGNTSGQVWVAFSPDGHTLASGNDNGTIQLWDITNPTHLHPLGQPLTGGNAPVQSVAFSPDGHTLASGNTDGTIWLWNVTDPVQPQTLGQPLTGGNAPVQSVAFSPDGHTLASGNTDGTIWLWNLNVQSAIERICTTIGGLTPQQWNKYIPQLQYEPSCIH